MEIIFFLIALLSSTIGSISGIGGGVIIKPVLDSISTVGVSTISFLSGCTVLSMSVVSLLRNTKSSVKLNKKIAISMAIGAAVGGMVGKSLFSYLKILIGNENSIGIIQAIMLLLINIGVFFYMKNKSNIVTKNYSNTMFCAIIGLTLGIISTFLGIGGGPINIAVLYYFFSMKPKETALNSLFIIFCSQLVSLVTTLITKTVPTFNLNYLILMCIGGIAGALIGSTISKKLTDKFVEKFFFVVVVLLIFINIFNICKFAVQM